MADAAASMESLRKPTDGCSPQEGRRNSSSTHCSLWPAGTQAWTGLNPSTWPASPSTSAALPCRPWTCYTLLRSQGYEVGRLVRYRCLVGQHIRLGGAAQRVGSLAFCVVIATAATVVMNRASTRPLTARKAAL